MTLPFEIAIWCMMVISLTYLGIISVLTYGWFSLKSNFVPFTPPATPVSIVIAIRNEAENILHLLESILQQSYPKDLIEVVVVDDNSTDDGPSLISKFAKNHEEIRVVLLSSTGKGKKAAIAFGIENSNYQFIITTDGDCVADKNWVRKMTAYFERYQPKIILGPVVYSGEKGLFQKLFSLDFLSLVASGAGGAGAGLPFMGNAANMAFDKSIFRDEDQQADYASGDDVFLIHSVKKHYGSDSIHFLKDNQASISTHAPKNRKEFFNQRVRWASKAKGYYDFWSILVSWVVLVFNLCLVFLFIAGLWWNWLLAVWILFVLLKALIDFPLLNGYAQLTGKGRLMMYLIPLELIYPLYIGIIGTASLFVKYSWKGREGLE
jgi:glycosyltransferase involved in cell wall biosynthesis